MGGGGSSSSGGGSNRGGTRGDGGGRAANNGGMSGGASRGGSNRGSGGGNRGLSSDRGLSSVSMASPGRSTPGSRDAPDGKRGSTMGPGGGSAPGSGGSSDGGGGRSTHPGRPGGEAGASIDGSGGYSGYSGNSDTSSFGGSSDRSESIAGSTDAKFSFNSDSAGSMTSLGDSDSGFGFGGNSSRASRSPSMPGRNSSFGVTNGAVTGGLDTTTEGYKTIVGDGELSDSERAREAAMADKMSVQPATRDRYSAQGLGIIGDNQPEMNTGFLGTVAGGLLAAGQNYLAGRKTAKELSGLEKDANLPSSFFGDNPSTYAQAYGSERLANSPLGFLGDDQANEKALVGSYNTNDGADGLDGKNQGSEPPPQEDIYPPEQQPGDPVGPAPGRRFGGSFGNYGSYARRFFSRT